MVELEKKKIILPVVSIHNFVTPGSVGNLKHNIKINHMSHSIKKKKNIKLTQNLYY